MLDGPRVSRSHCKLVRADVGPSRWRLIDNRSTNGTFINDERIGDRELRDSDVVNIGDNLFTYRLLGNAPPAIVGGINCPSCGTSYHKSTKICVPCGVDIRTGKPLITSHGLDADEVQVKAETSIRIISWLIPFGIYPIASEAFGTAKPYAIWTITALTILISAIFFIASKTADEDQAQPMANLMLWSGRPVSEADFMRRFESETHTKMDAHMRSVIAAAIAKEQPNGEFHCYQLLTHAVLHGGIMHLAGNMLFLIVFGTRVNALIGNIATAIVYPLLAIMAGTAHMLASAHGPLHPMLGASGAIMGLAGMNFVLFPVHRVFMAIWLRLGLLTGFHVVWKVWALRGFWVVLFYIAFDVLATSLGSHDGVAHWAHLGGFISGMLVALLMLLTRLINARGGDILSRILGKRAWVLIGRPGEEVAVRPLMA